MPIYKEMKPLILGKKIVSRTETLEYASMKFNWNNVAVGISCYFGFWAWVKGRLTGRKVIYYCIDFYSPEHPINKRLKNRVFIWLAMQMDRFLCLVSDDVWDISERINEGRYKFGGYTAKSKILPLSYPPDYFRFNSKITNSVAFVGLDPYGIELLDDYIWLGKDKLLPLNELLDKLSVHSIGVSLWEHKGNNYYGDPGKTKLYLACGIPVVMTDNTPFAYIVKDTHAGIIVPYDKKSVRQAISTILSNYDYYKQNVRKTWRYINTDEVFNENRYID